MHIASPNKSVFLYVCTFCMVATLSGCGGSGGSGSENTRSSDEHTAKPGMPSSAQPQNPPEAGDKKANEPPPVALDRSASVAGIDRNFSGIRDDIEELITKLGPPEQKSALEQVARSIQASILFDGTQKGAVQAAVAIDRALGCLASKSPDYAAQSEILFATTINSEARYRALMAFEKELGFVAEEMASAKCD